MRVGDCSRLRGGCCRRATRLWPAVISAPDAFERRRRIWQSAPHGLDLRAALRFVDNELEKVRARPDQQLSEPIRWASLALPDAHRPGGARRRHLHGHEGRRRARTAGLVRHGARRGHRLLQRARRPRRDLRTDVFSVARSGGAAGRRSRRRSSCARIRSARIICGPGRPRCGPPYALPTVDLQEFPALPGIAAQAGADVRAGVVGRGGEALEVLEGMRAGRTIGRDRRATARGAPGRFRVARPRARIRGRAGGAIRE